MSFDPLTLFKSLADDTRLKIMFLIKKHGEVCVCDLATALELSQPKISRHLAILRDNQLVEGERRGKWVHYAFHAQLPAWAGSMLNDALDKHPEFMQECLARYESGCTAAGLC